MDPAFVDQNHSCSPEDLLRGVYPASLYVCIEELLRLPTVFVPGSEPTCREHHRGLGAPGALQAAKQERQPQASRLLFQAFIGKMILYVSVNARMQLEVFKDAKMSKGFGRSSEVRW